MVRVALSIGTLEVGGAETFVVNLLKHLDHSRFRALLIVLGGKTGSFLEKEVEALPIEVRYVSKKEGFSLKALFKVRSILREFKPDILHGNTGGLVYFLPFLFFKRIKAVYTAHTFPEIEFRPCKRFLISLLIKKGKILPVGISPEIKEKLEKLYGVNPIPLIENGIDVHRFRCERDLAGPVTLGSVGRFEREKNHGTTIKVFFRLKESFPDLRLRLVGDGSLLKEYREAYARKDIAFLGKSEKVEEELRKIDVFLIPSFREGLPLAVLEAMASGCAVVGSRVGGLKDLIKDGENGFLVGDPTDVEGFVRAVKELLLKPELLKKVSENNIRKAEAYHIKETARKYQELYLAEAGNA